MKKYALGTRVVLLVLVALLALPIAQTASPVEARRRARTVTRTFTNPTAITVPISSSEPVSATLYPSPIAVRGLKGTIRDVNVRLDFFRHGSPDELQLLLVGPGGQTAVVMANVGGNLVPADPTLTLDDEATAPLPDQTRMQSGSFRPTNATGNTIVFNGPAPSASASSALSVFDGGDPNGTWRLFMQDQNGEINEGGFYRGWALEITAKVKAKKKRR